MNSFAGACVVAVFAFGIGSTGCAADAPDDTEPGQSSSDALRYDDDEVQKCGLHGDSFLQNLNAYGLHDDVASRVAAACSATTKHPTGTWSVTVGTGGSDFSIDVSGPTDGNFDRCITAALEDQHGLIHKDLKNHSRTCTLHFAFGPR